MVRSMRLLRSLCCLGLTFAALQPAMAADKVTLLFDWLPSGQYSPWYYGVTAGCFADQKIDLAIKRGFGGADSVTKVASGTAEFGIADLGTIMLARLRTDAAVRAIMPIYVVSPLALAVLDDSPVKTMKDLEGRRLGAAPGDSAALILPIAMADAGADLSKVSRVSVEPTGIAAFLIQGRVDAVTTYVTSAIGIDMTARSVGKSVRTIDFGKSLGIYGNAIVAADALIKSSPDLVRRFTIAAVCAFAKARAAPDEAVAALRRDVPELPADGQRALLDTALSLVAENAAAAASWDDTKLKKTLDVTLTAQGLKSDATPQSFVMTP